MNESHYRTGSPTRIRTLEKKSSTPGKISKSEYDCFFTLSKCLFSLVTQEHTLQPMKLRVDNMFSYLHFHSRKDNALPILGPGNCKLKQGFVL